MKLQSRCLGISAAAILLLQMGSFVDAAPFFHIDSDDMTSTTSANICQDLHITFPSEQNFVLEDASKHIVAWQAPSGLSQVELSLVADTSDNDSTQLGSYSADRGSSDEISFDLQGRQPGTYHIHLHATGQQTCDVDSASFTIQERSDTQNSAGPDSQPPPQSHMNNEQLEALMQEIKQNNKATPQTTHLDNQQLDAIMQDVKKQVSSHTDGDPEWSSMMNNLNNVYPKKTPPAPKWRKTQTGNSHPNEVTGQEANDNNEHASSSKPSSNTSTSSKYESFEKYIKSLDQDFKKYIANNKESENHAVTHKNDAGIDQSTPPTVHPNVNAELSRMLAKNKATPNKLSSHISEELSQMLATNEKSSKTLNHHVDAELSQLLATNGKQQKHPNDGDSDQPMWQSDNPGGVYAEMPLDDNFISY